MSEKTILVTNDDSIVSPGIKALVEAVRPFGRVVVVAPDSPQSGKGHAITLEEPLRLRKVDVFDGIEAYQCSGTPVDCVKLAVDQVLKGKPDLCVSGINHGSNSSINVIYSGTMSAAMEASIEGITAIGFSYLDYSFQADFSACKHYASILAQKALNGDFEQGTLLNVNFPILPLDSIKGMKVCKQAKAKWIEEFDSRTDPRGRQYYWLTGEFVNGDTDEDTDEWALANGYVSIVPVKYDLTDYVRLSQLKNTIS
ncbi:MAG: 5'/3'-nucleotidase SurE [Saprospiraceae bacterium]|nr:5'/3'-nucleotidase SurE [Saprospiraceae bacterium]